MSANQPTNPSTPTATGISLWLAPEGVTRTRLAVLIDGLAVRLSTPPFAPHLTLLAAIDVPPDEALARARALAVSLRSFPIRLRGIEGRDEYFRCLFAHAELDTRLREAHAVAARAFGREPEAAFLPHVSLVYGTLPAARKLALARELAAELPASFDAARLHVWRTQGATSAWRELGACELAE